LGVRVNAVCPGVTADTGMFNSVLDMAPEFEKALLPAIPMGRCGRPHEIAHGVLYLCSEAASYVTGQGLQIDGGFTVP